MNTGTRIGGFAVALGVVFAGALGVGKLVGPVERPAEAAPAHDMERGGGGHADMPEEKGEQVGGLGVAQGDFRIDLVTAQLPAGATSELSFRIVDGRNIPVSSFAEVHEELMHVFVVRRDLSDYHHVHATMAGDGTWTAHVTPAMAGSYRVLADFQPATSPEGVTLGADLSVPGDFQPHPLPTPSATATVDGYTVSLNGVLIPGHPSGLTFSVSQGGRPVTDLQPYLGAYGHLVALRSGDLAHLHVHPEESTTTGPAIVFTAETPSAGFYRLYLEFQHAGVVHRAEFTAEARGSLPYPSTSDSSGTEHGHGGGS